jgi:hypothetical protein
MTMGEFIEQRIKPDCVAKCITMEHFYQRNIVLRCACEEPGCEGWAILSRSFPEEIERHNRDYAPGGTFAKTT